MKLRTIVLVTLSGIAVAPMAAAARGAAKLETRKIDPEETQGAEAYQHLRFASTYLGQGMLQQAREECLRALAVQPEFPEAHYTLGLVLLELKDYRGALAEGDRILEKNPYFTEAHNLRGYAFGKMGDLDSALRAFEAVKADASYPTPEVAHFNIGRVFWERKACAEAVLHFRRALEINPKFWRAWYLMADCQGQLGQVAEARESYGKVFELEPSDAKSHFGLGLLCFSSGDMACARLHLMKVLELAPSSEEAEQAREYLKQINFR
jgi:tetratricopeptide (TPR) repeat protein